MIDIDIYPSTKKQNFKTLLQLGLNKDVIELIYQFKNDIEFNDNLFNKLSNKYIYDEYFKFCIPRNNGIEWCIKYENDRERDFLTNRIDIIFEPHFMIEKIEKKRYLMNGYHGTIHSEHNDYIYFIPNLFRKIEISNKLSESQILEIYEENDVYIYWDDCPRNI